jgi:hypothetical protein
VSALHTGLCCFQAARWQAFEQYLADRQLLHLLVLLWTRLESDGPEKVMQAGLLQVPGCAKLVSTRPAARTSCCS